MLIESSPGDPTPQLPEKKFWETLRPTKVDGGSEGGKSGKDFPWSHREYSDGAQLDFKRFTTYLRVPVSSVRELLGPERFAEFNQKFPNFPKDDTGFITMHRNDLNLRIGDQNFATNDKGDTVYGEYAGIANAMYSNVLRAYEVANSLKAEEKK